MLLSLSHCSATERVDSSCSYELVTLVLTVLRNNKLLVSIKFAGIFSNTRAILSVALRHGIKNFGDRIPAPAKCKDKIFLVVHRDS